MFKSKSLSTQIWVYFISITIGISLIISIVLYFSLESYFLDEIYARLESSQMTSIESTSAVNSSHNSPNSFTNEALENIGTGVISSNTSNSLPKHIEDQLISNASLPTTTAIGRYELDVNGKNLYYVLSKKNIGDDTIYVYSYVWDNLKVKVFSLLKKAFLALLVLFILLLIPSRLICKSLINSLSSLENDMKKIAKRDWSSPINLDCPTEVYSLAISCESMRQQLIDYDSKQQSMLQNISHELKTPIMVIRSYVDAMKDGFYPKGDIESSLDVISQEAQRLEKRTLDLISISNLEYISSHKHHTNKVNLNKLITNIYEHLKYKRGDINFIIELIDAEILGFEDQLRVLVENLLQNALRYASSRIKISLSSTDEYKLLSIYNDGPNIADDNSIFEAFKKGVHGENGLGLSIVKKVSLIHDAKVWFENSPNMGVTFYVKFRTMPT